MVKQARLFDDVIGHDRVVRLLGEELERPAHAYLFVGPGAVGKATVARRFAAGLLCPTGANHAQPCSSCRRVASGNHPDLMVVEPEGRTMMTVDQARSTVASATLAPFESARKVILVDDAGMMSEAAANALLKTLEEPTTSTVFVLIAESEDDLPPTVASRCRTVHFGRVEEESIVAAIAAGGVDPIQAAEAARISGGRPGLALAFATRPEVAEFRLAWLAIPLRVSPRPADAFQLAEEVLAGTGPLLASMKERQAEEEALHDGKAVKDRHERELRRASQALVVSGLEILASWYTDAASAQFGGPVRNRDVPVAALAQVPPAVAVARAERVLDAVIELLANLRPPLVLATLFTDLAGDA